MRGKRKYFFSNSLDQFYEFLSPDFDTSKNGRIWNGTIDKFQWKILTLEKVFIWLLNPLKTKRFEKSGKRYFRIIISR